MKAKDIAKWRAQTRAREADKIAAERARLAALPEIHAQRADETVTLGKRTQSHTIGRGVTGGG